MRARLRATVQRTRTHGHAGPPRAHTGQEQGASSMEKRIGIVGMGLMGQAFILNLRKSQFRVQGYDVDPRRMDELREQGGHPADTPADAAKDVDIVITSVPTSDIGREAMLGTHGIAHWAREGLIIADTTTARPEDSERLSADLEIGRTSCWERVCQDVEISVVAVSLKTKKTIHKQYANNIT